MNSPLQIGVGYQGQQVGTLVEARGGIFFEYAREFLATGHELSPLMLPLSAGLKTRDSQPTMRLHGLFEDSLPDRWGRRVMSEWFARHGVAAHDVTPMRMLACVGDSGMGALTYKPALAVDASHHDFSLAAVHDAAQKLTRFEALSDVDLDALAKVGSSAGGAQPKALVALRPTTDDARPFDMRNGIVDALPRGFEPWLVKFDLSADGSDGVMEFAYAALAREAGVDVPEALLLTTHNSEGSARRHFAVKRFDRELPADAAASRTELTRWERIHHHTLAGMCHVMGGDLDYSTLLRVARRITRNEREVWRAFRRAVFNVLASNRDDHGKNHGFIYRDGEWTLGPAYDLTFRSRASLPERGMAVLGQRANVGKAELLKLAESEALQRKTALEIIEQVETAISRWLPIASNAGVPDQKAREIERALRG